MLRCRVVRIDCVFFDHVIQSFRQTCQAMGTQLTYFLIALHESLFPFRVPVKKLNVQRSRVGPMLVLGLVLVLCQSLVVLLLCGCA